MQNESFVAHPSFRIVWEINEHVVQSSSRLSYQNLVIYMASLYNRTFYMFILLRANLFIVQPSSRLVIVKIIFLWLGFLPG